MFREGERENERKEYFKLLRLCTHSKSSNKNVFKIIKMLVIKYNLHNINKKCKNINFNYVP